MKKLFACAISAFIAISATAALPVFAQTNQIPIAADTETGSPDDSSADIKAPDKILLNGEEIKTSHKPMMHDDVLLVPLRPIAEALGFQVTWNAEEQIASLDDGLVKTAVKLGVDSYYKSSSKALGLTQSKPLGAPPILSDSVLYVPVSLFPLLYSDAEILSIQDGTIEFTTIVECD